ncbi:hypothetical protein D3C72_1689070 [compost metagenome]
MRGKQPSTCTVGAGVQLHAQHGQRIQAKANRARGVTGARVKGKALGPLLALVLPGTIAKITIDVKICSLESHLSIFNKPFCTCTSSSEARGNSEQITCHLVFITHGELQ